MRGHVDPYYPQNYMSSRSSRSDRSDRSERDFYDREYYDVCIAQVNVITRVEVKGERSDH